MTLPSLALYRGPSVEVQFKHQRKHNMNLSTETDSPF